MKIKHDIFCWFVSFSSLFRISMRHIIKGILIKTLLSKFPEPKKNLLPVMGGVTKTYKGNT